MKRFTGVIRGRFGRADYWGFGFALVPRNGLVVGLGPWTLELDW